MCLLSCRVQLEVEEREELTKMLEILILKVFLVDQVLRGVQGTRGLEGARGTSCLDGNHGDQGPTGETSLLMSQQIQLSMWDALWWSHYTLLDHPEPTLKLQCPYLRAVR